MAKSPNWSFEEIEMLLKYYESEERDFIEKVLPRRNWQSILCMGAKKGLKRRQLLDFDYKYIKENHETLSSKEIGEYLRIHPETVKRVIRKLGFIKQSFWTKEEDQFILDNYENMDVSQMSSKINRTESSIYHRKQQLGIQKKTKRYSYTKDELSVLLKDVSKNIGRTPNEKELSKYGLPSESYFSKVFGSYSSACEYSGLDINFGMAKYTKCYSKNNDVCLSNAEKMITDFFIDNNIIYSKEVKYSSIVSDKECGKMVCDWVLFDGTLVEYFGIRSKKYKEKIERKLTLCIKHSLSVIELYEKDLNKLEKIFSSYKNP